MPHKSSYCGKLHPREAATASWRQFEMWKKLTGKALATFEAKRDVWQEVLDGVREIKAGGG
jgi:hypothetical protein